MSFTLSPRNDAYRDELVDEQEAAEKAAAKRRQDAIDRHRQRARERRTTHPATPTHTTAKEAPVTTTRKTPDLAALRKTTFTSLQGVLTDYTEGISRAQTFTDPDLNPDGLRRRQQALRDEARAAAVERATTAVKTLQDEAARAVEAAAPHRLTLNEDDPNELTRTAQAWEFNILPQLRDGRRWEDVLSGLTRDDALAVQRFAPAHIKAHATKPGEADEYLRLIDHAIEAQQADLATTDEGRHLINTAHTMQGAASKAEHITAVVSDANSIPQLAAAQITVTNQLAFGE